MIKEKERDMKNYEVINYQNLKKSESMDKYLIKECLNVANAAHFPTDYDDVKEHLFGSDNLIKLFIIDREMLTIKGFLAADYFKGYCDNNILHCHGIIVHPDIQSMGYSKMLVNALVKEYQPDIVTAKTHNPRCFNMFTEINDVKAYFPNNFEIPEDIYNLVKTDPYIKVVDHDLVFRDAYPDEKIQQEYRNQELKEIFSKVGFFDAQAIVVVLNDSKLNIKGKQKIKR